MLSLAHRISNGPNVCCHHPSALTTTQPWLEGHVMAGEKSINVRKGVKGFLQQPLAERFWAKVCKSEHCWLWQGPTDGRYGEIWYNGAKCRAHRITWELVNGPIPEGLLVCHTCDTPSCVRPDHLFLGTMSDNILDASRKGRLDVRGRAHWTHCAKGHPFSGVNLMINKHGHRVCRVCRDARNAKRYRKTKRTP